MNSTKKLLTFTILKEQLELIELGVLDEQEVIESLTVVGRKVTETQIKKINITGQFAKVIIKTDFTEKDVFKEETEDDLFEDDDIFSSDEIETLGIDDMPF